MLNNFEPSFPVFFFGNQQEIKRDFQIPFFLMLGQRDSDDRQNVHLVCDLVFLSHQTFTCTKEDVIGQLFVVGMLESGLVRGHVKNYSNNTNHLKQLWGGNCQHDWCT